MKTSLHENFLLMTIKIMMIILQFSRY